AESSSESSEDDSKEVLDSEDGMMGGCGGNEEDNIPQHEGQQHCENEAEGAYQEIASSFEGHAEVEDNMVGEHVAIDREHEVGDLGDCEGDDGGSDTASHAMPLGPVEEQFCLGTEVLEVREDERGAVATWEAVGEGGEDEDEEQWLGYAEEDAIEEDYRGEAQLDAGDLEVGERETELCYLEDEGGEEDEEEGQWPEEEHDTRYDYGATVKATTRLLGNTIASEEDLEAYLTDLQRRVFTWLCHHDCARDVEYLLHKLRHKMASGFLIGCLLSHYYPSELEENRFNSGLSMVNKSSNWAFIQKFMRRRQCPVNPSHAKLFLEGPVHAVEGTQAALDLLTGIYRMLLAEGKVPPMQGTSPRHHTIPAPSAVPLYKRSMKRPLHQPAGTKAEAKAEAEADQRVHPAMGHKVVSMSETGAAGRLPPKQTQKQKQKQKGVEDVEAQEELDIPKLEDGTSSTRHAAQHAKDFHRSASSSAPTKPTWYPPPGPPHKPSHPLKAQGREGKENASLKESQGHSGRSRTKASLPVALKQKNHNEQRSETQVMKSSQHLSRGREPHDEQRSETQVMKSSQHLGRGREPHEGRHSKPT
ncbi:unnamed protein product, partial [Chrysoparadoxa australica]